MEEVIFETRNFNNSDLGQLHTIHLNNYPIVYILYNSKKPTAYIGQTVHVNRRLQDHLSNPKRKVHEQTILIGHEKFNQSATYNIETNLINYFIADNHYKLQNVSQTTNKKMHNYYQKELYDKKIFHQIWEKLREEEIAQNTIEDLQNKDIYKISPYKELSEQQLEVKEKVIQFCNENAKKAGQHVFIVEGDSGTGKSVLLSSLFNTLQDNANDASSNLYNTDNYLLVNHSEMLKTYHNIAYSLPNLKKKQFKKPTPFINSMDKGNEKADITLVDEAHLLLSKEDSYNNFRYDNQLDEIIKRSNITIVIFDPKQVLKIKSYWNERLLQEVTKQYNAETLKLTHQFRVNAAPGTLDWIDQFAEKYLKPIPHNESDHFDLKVFDDPEQFKKTLTEKNEQYGLSRMVSTFDYVHKKDGDTYYVDPSGINMPWNITHENKTWAEEAETINEVGSIYTVQGFDLNYVGVILGPSVKYDEENDKLFIDTGQYEDKGAFTSRKDLSFEENEEIKEEIILNSINVLMKRGIHGLYIYPTDPKLRRRLLQLKGMDHDE
ncbi:DUF2075 domain-containing protein [Alkalibacillus haloalkaliphilus]|uniref:DUF2075 domain-containing protein n=1 Tax=Alkalibacillus haloalkaliphilus TaxID=94136 RepID=UPI0029362FC1|nr:DUF2075 domain-containing protein [Alkalibacillus haloalkaliphilus]MDV2583334.1 DUF2075 domain-containing protein [Alkalibacillus haloalkaliphilus]